MNHENFRVPLYVLSTLTVSPSICAIDSCLLLLQPRRPLRQCCWLLPVQQSLLPLPPSSFLMSSATNALDGQKRTLLFLPLFHNILFHLSETLFAVWTAVRVSAGTATGKTFETCDIHLRDIVNTLLLVGLRCDLIESALYCVAGLSTPCGLHKARLCRAVRLLIGRTAQVAYSNTMLQWL